MFPLLPSAVDSELDEWRIRVISGDAGLGKGLHPAVLASIRDFMVDVNSYYTNAMEGNPSKLRDIEKAKNHQYSKDPALRNYQKEHIAHIAVQKEMIARIEREPELKICSKEFICWLHREFYSRLPPEMHFAKSASGKAVPLVPGEIRSQGVTVGAHDLAPVSRGDIENALDTFDRFLDPEKIERGKQPFALAGSHHRLLWIHPFSDGNGRVARLFSTAYKIRIALGHNLLWTETRAFARDRAEYDRYLHLADLPRTHDFDGRGPLSERNLVDFCKYFLRVCDDQIQYMESVLELGRWTERFGRYVNNLVDERALSKSGRAVLMRLVKEGRIERREIRSICRVKERRASQIVRELLGASLVVTDSAYGPLSLKITADAAGFLFPQMV